MKNLYLIFSLFLISALTSVNAQIIDTLQTRAEFQQFPTHEPGFEIDQNNGTLYYGGTTGLYYSTDNGDSWSYNPFIVSGNERAIHYLELNQNTGRLYASSTDGGIGYTDDMGSTWEILNTSSSYALYIDENNVCFGNVGALFRWTDGDWANRVNLLIQVTKVTPGDGGYLYAVSESDDKIYYSTDEGVNWEIGVDADDEAKFIIPKSNNEVIYSNWGEGLFQAPQDFSSDASEIGGTFLDGIKLDNGFMWLISSNTTWIFSDDNGATLVASYGALTEDLLNGVEAPSIDADGIKDQLDTYNGKIYLAETKGRIYTVESGTVNVSELDSKNLDVFPNPINTGASLKINTTETPETIEILDMAGKCVATSFNSKSIATENLSSGMYFVKVQVGNRLRSAKLIVQ